MEKLTILMTYSGILFAGVYGAAYLVLLAREHLNDRNNKRHNHDLYYRGCRKGD